MKESNIKEVLEFAIKGIVSEMQEKEKTIRQGEELIKKKQSGLDAKTELTVDEIQKVVNAKRQELETLDKKLFSYKWKLSTMDEE